jgi:UDP-galactopyranose mutase
MFKDYTFKQWNKYPEELSPEILARIPVRSNFDTRYFSDKYQLLPEKGYTHFFNKIIETNSSVVVCLNTNFFDIKKDIKNQIVIYTGPIDHYYSESGLPNLEYRSINFEITKLYNTHFYQPNSVVNYLDLDIQYTRCVEYKHFLNQPSDHTIIVKETTTDIGEPYYPVLNQKNMKLYAKYKELSSGDSVHFLGRLASYKYFNMDQAIKNALDYFENHFM